MSTPRWIVFKLGVALLGLGVFSWASSVHAAPACTSTWLQSGGSTTLELGADSAGACDAMRVHDAAANYTVTQCSVASGVLTESETNAAYGGTGPVYTYSFVQQPSGCTSQITSAQLIQADAPSTSPASSSVQLAFLAGSLFLILRMLS